MKTIGVMALMVGLCWGISAAVQAQDADCGSPGRCAICGRPGPCQQKVCMIQCGVEKVKQSCWCAEVVDICTMRPTGPRHAGCNDPACGCDPGTDCGLACEGTDCGLGCGEGASCGEPGCDAAGRMGLLGRLGKSPNPMIPPQPGRTRTIKKLVKKEYTVQKPVYKAVVQWVCADCLAAKARGGCTGESGPTPAVEESKPLPPAPAPEPAPAEKDDPGAEQTVLLAPLPPMPPLPPLPPMPPM
ncbi:MAG: hypothetical protein GYA33_04335 [Thermogutta sp.]|nr:hypothetical protein [Thermogutta sp.]